MVYLYRVVLSVGKNGEIDTVYNVGKLKEALPPRGSMAHQNKSDIGAMASDKSIPPNAPIVKKENDGENQYFIPTEGDDVEARGTIDGKACVLGVIIKAYPKGNMQTSFMYMM